MKCDNSERDWATSAHLFVRAKEPVLDDYDLLKALSANVHRGLHARVIHGLSTGGRCFGYRHVAVEDPSRLTGFGRPRIVAIKVEIDPDEASVVRNIFSLFGRGHSMAEIARLLNAGGALGPRVGINSPRSAWNRDSIRRILRNSRYCGRLT